MHSDNASRAKASLLAHFSGGKWSDDSLYDYWRNAKDQIGAPGVSDADKTIWTEVMKLARDQFSPGLELVAEKKYETARKRSFSSAYGIPPATATTRQVQRTIAFGDASLYGVLSKIFVADPRPFSELPLVTRTLYELVWDLPIEQRLLLIRSTGSHLSASASNEHDTEQLSTWLLELFRQTYGVLHKPGELVFVGRYINPDVLSSRGQESLMRMVDYYFDPIATHSGGLNSDMKLRRPNFERIRQLDEGILAEFIHPSPRISLLSSAMVTGNPYPDDDDDGEEGGVPSTTAAATATPIVASDDFLIPPELIAPLLDEEPVRNLRIRRIYVSVAIYKARLRAYLEEWLISPARSVPQSLTEQAEIDFEAAALKTVQEDHLAYKDRKTKLFAAISAEREARRLSISDVTVKELSALIDQIEVNFVGMYRAKADVLEYLQRQLTGPRPRLETSNHLVATGEPGTGKTSLMRIAGQMMIRLNLIDPPTLEAYKAVGGTFQRNVTTAVEERITATVLPGSVPAALRDHIGNSAMFSLQAYVHMTGGQTRLDPGYYDPGKFESEFEGGQLAQFLLAVFRTLGSAMIIDEAYGLGAARFRGIVDQIVALITELGTRWSTMLLGYEDAMRNFFATTNEGLERRYAATFALGHYSAIELTVILARLLLASDNILLAADPARASALALLPSDSSEIRADANAVLTELYEKVGPYAMRGDRRAVNMFRTSNVGALQKFADLLYSSYAIQFTTDKTMMLVTPAAAGTALETRAAATPLQPFGSWTAAINYDDPKTCPT